MFDNIIGYEYEKRELAKFCDIIRNTNYYKNFNIKLPKGLMLVGDPGVGKTTFSNYILQYSRRPTYVLRKNADTAGFIMNMKEVFEKAKETAPSVILLDDMDKFGNGEPFAQEYTSLQGFIDEYRDYDIFIIATVNEIYKLPNSIRRSGRFDKTIYIENPNDNDSDAITRHYLSDKNLDPSVNMETICLMLHGRSCAELESVINMAGMNAVYERSNTIKMHHITDAIFNTLYGLNPLDPTMSSEERYMAAIHEAGHVVIIETLSPGGLSFATIRESDLLFDGKDIIDTDGLRGYLMGIMVNLAGKAAIDIKFGVPDIRAKYDLKVAMDYANIVSANSGFRGFDNIPTENEYGMIMYSKSSNDTLTDAYNEVVGILKSNWNFVEGIANLFMQKDTIIQDDIVILKHTFNCGVPMFNNLIIKQ